jgi:hypothetical protein
MIGLRSRGGRKKTKKVAAFWKKAAQKLLAVWAAGIILRLDPLMPRD